MTSQTGVYGNCTVGKRLAEFYRELSFLRLFGFHDTATDL